MKNALFLEDSKPSGYLPSPVEVEEVAFMAWVRTKGDSMTCNDGRSIPDGSIILIKELRFQEKNVLDKALSIPVRRPLAFELQDTNGIKHFVVKTVSFVDAVYYRLRLSSYNKKYRDFWVPFSHIHKIYTVEAVEPPKFMQQKTSL